MDRDEVINGVENGERALLACLRENGLPATPGLVAIEATHGTAVLERAWDAFKRFAQMPVRDPHLSRHPDEDGLLFETGVFDFECYGGEHYLVSFTRQFILEDEDGEYDRMEQVAVKLLYDPVALIEQQRAPEGNFWSFDLGVEEFCRRVERAPGFNAPREAGVTPIRLYCRQSGV